MESQGEVRFQKRRWRFVQCGCNWADGVLLGAAATVLVSSEPQNFDTAVLKTDGEVLTLRACPLQQQ